MADHTHALTRLAATIHARKISLSADASYTATLFAKGTDTILKKVGEEATEFVIAAKHASLGGEKTPMVKEAADVLYHLLVALEAHGSALDDVLQELARREGVSGLVEKRSRAE